MAVTLPRENKPVVLRPQLEFNDFSARGESEPQGTEAERIAIAQNIAQHYNPTNTYDSAGAEFLAALATPPERQSKANRLVSQILADVEPYECARLVAQCGVRHADLARHARSIQHLNPALAAWLNDLEWHKFNRWRYQDVPE